MACCGSRRQQLTSLQQRFAGSALQSAPQPGPTPGPTPGPSPDRAPGGGRLALLYVGTAALALRSPLSGRLYRLEPGGSPFWVVRQDGDLLLATGLCHLA